VGWCEVELTGEQYRDEVLRNQVEQDLRQSLTNKNAIIETAEWLCVSSFGDAPLSKFRFIVKYKEAASGL